MPDSEFSVFFQAATGDLPFPWQITLYEKFVNGDIPSTANIPTGLGKTSVVAIWLIALAQRPDRVPRRLVYVVNRRTVVDQTTSEVERLRGALTRKPELAGMRDALAILCALPLPTPDAPPLAISTLRGQFADNGEWRTDPSRPAVVVGTVDMIGSGLLFSRYAVGFKTRPHHAALLGQDVLLVHDEAHLEPAFQKLIRSIAAAQSASADPRQLRIMQLTATNRDDDHDTPFTLNAADHENEVVKQRINAVKKLTLEPLTTGEKLDEKIVKFAKDKATESNGDRAILIYVRTVEIALKVADALNKNEYKNKVAVLTGIMRGKERDELVSGNSNAARVFQRLLPGNNSATTPGVVFLVATSAGEVGVNISADDLVCDLSTYESMAQRFGRVNRFGHRNDTTITVLYETKFDTENKKNGVLEAARKRTLALLQKLDSDASPAALERLSKALLVTERVAAFSPEPKLRVATAIQFDAWALTSIREPIAARPPVAPYLHGEAEWQPPETHLAWRDDLDLQQIEDPEAFLDAFPLKSAELLRDTTARIVKTLGSLLEKREADAPPVPDAWLVTENGSVSRFPFSAFDKDTAETSLAAATLILPACLGGIDANGLFSASATSPASDCSGIERRESGLREPAADFSLTITDEDAEETRYLLWFAPLSEPTAKRRGITTASETLDAHTNAVTANAAAIAAKLFPEAPVAGTPDLGRCLVVAASLHDLGKDRAPWQRNLGNLAYDPTNPATIFAKSGGKMRPRNIAEYYRHEFGSLLDAELDPDFNGLTETEREITLHLVAAHHGRARPYFPVEESFDYSGNSAAPVVAADTPRRFARLQKRFGRWGLAWLESLLRAADYAASADIVAPPAPPLRDRSPAPAPAARVLNSRLPSPTATLAINPANPGHYFACCGLFELVTRPRLFPDAVAWFEQTDTGFRFHLANTPPLTELLEKITTAEITVAEDSASDDAEEPDGTEADEEEETESEKEASAPALLIGAPFDLRLDWWTTASPATSALKIWAGSMKVLGIARSMSYTVAQSLASYRNIEEVLFETCPAYDPSKISANKAKAGAAYLQAVRKAAEKQTEALKKAGDEKSGEKLEKEKAKIARKYEEDIQKAELKRDSANVLKGAKKEPFYFDANRGPNSDARDVGFSVNDLSMETLAAPAAEFLTLVGLQRAIPEPSGDRLFDYHLWQTPVPIALLAAAINGLTDSRPQPSFRFESWYRTSQRKHKAFLPAKPL